MFLHLNLWLTKRRLTRLYLEIERHRALMNEVENESDVHREVRNMVYELTRSFEDATVQSKLIETRIRTARARKEIRGRLKK